MKHIIHKLWQHQIIRFVCVGSLNTVLDFVFLNIFFEIVGLPSLIANTMSVLISISISYLLNHYVVFKHSQKPNVKNYVRFLLVTGASVLGVQNIVIYIVSHLVSVSPGQGIFVFGHFISSTVVELNAAKALAAVIGVAWNFLLYKYVVFSNKKNNDNPEDILAG